LAARPTPSSGELLSLSRSVVALAAKKGRNKTTPPLTSFSPPRTPNQPHKQNSYEDNFDAVNNLMVLTQPTGAKNVEDLGAPEKVLESLSFLLGKQNFSGKTISEGGFAPDRVVAASLLDVSTIKDKKGKSYYRYQILTRTADGDEGGRHQVITAGVSGGKLWILKVQVGDKRWFKGVDKEALGTSDSFTLA
jgi:hypothetical protein